jgi:hypothetical protein
MLTIGQQLKAARMQKKASLSDAAEATRIIATRLEMLEADHFEEVGVAIYVKGFIRMYSEYLGLDPEALVREYVALHAPARTPIPHDTAPKLVGRRHLPPAELAPRTELGAGWDDEAGPAGGGMPAHGPARGESIRNALRSALDTLTSPRVLGALRTAALAVIAVAVAWMAIRAIAAGVRRIADRPPPAPPSGLTAVVEDPPDPFLDPQTVRAPSLPGQRP